MKVNCPHCHCNYDLEPVKMPGPKYNAMHESWGWKFECGACDHQWWLKLVNAEGYSTAQRNGTNNGYIDDRFYNNHYQNSRSGLSTKRSKDDESTEEVKNLPIVLPKRQKERVEKLVPPPLPRYGVDEYFNHQKSDSSSLFWIYVLVLFIILAGIVYTYRDVFYQKLQALMQQSSMQMSAMSLPLNIKNVHWDKVVMPDGSIKVAVVGEVINQNSVTSRLRPLHMSAWGPCDPAEAKPTRCMAGGSMYDFQKPTILPEEHVSFQTSWVLPKGSVVTGVDVTLQ